MALPNPLDSRVVRSKTTAGNGTSSLTTYMHALVKSVDGDKAWVTDQLGKMRQLSTTRIFGKAVVAPKVGETWLITSIFGDWMFAVCVNAPIVNFGTSITKDYATAATPDTLVYRNDSGTAQIATPVDDNDITNKAYVEDYVTSAIINGGTIPSPPQSLALNSSLYLTSQNKYRLKTHLGWTPPTTNTDGTAVSDLHHYELSWQYTDLPTDTEWHSVPNVPADAIDSYGNHSVAWLEVQRGHHVNVQIRAVDRYQNRSAYVTASGTLNGAYGPPPIPSTPVLDTYLGFHRAYWDGNNSDGSAVPVDFSHIEVHWSNLSGFTPSSVTLVTTMSAAGYYTHRGNYSVTGYFVFIEVDESGNKGSPSAQAGNTPMQITNADINDVSMDKATDGTLTSTVALTGSITAGLAGAQSVVIDGTGLQAFDTNGNQTIKISSIDGSIALPQGGSISGASLDGGSIGGTGVTDATITDSTFIVDGSGGDILIYAASAPSQVALTPSSSSPWSVPPGVTSIKVEAWGAGGGSPASMGAGGSFAAWAAATGGGGEYACEANYPIASGVTSIPFVVGQGGANSGTTTAGKGGNTTFNVGGSTPVVAHGGQGGGQYTTAYAVVYGGGGSGGTGSTNSIHFDGGDGVDVNATGNSAQLPIGGSGGGGAAGSNGGGKSGKKGTKGTTAAPGAGGAGIGLGGNGGSGGSTGGGNGLPGNAFGGGAGSGGVATSTSVSGGSGNTGADGHILITYYGSITLIASISATGGTDANGFTYPAGIRIKNFSANGGSAGGLYYYRAIGSTGAGQSIPSGTPTTLTGFNSIRAFSDYPSTVWSGGSFTVPETGIYSFYLWSDNIVDSSTPSSIYIQQNGATVARTDSANSSGAGANSGVGTYAANIYCVVGDTFIFRAYQATGTAKTVTGFITIKKEI